MTFPDLVSCLIGHWKDLRPGLVIVQTLKLLSNRCSRRLSSYY
jgi:hypothetical protein